MSASLPAAGLFPGVVRGEYPQRDPRGMLAPELRRWLALVPPAWTPYARFAGRVSELLSERLSGRSSGRSTDHGAAFGARASALRAGLVAARGWSEPLLEQAFVLACDAAESTLGLRAYPTQVAAARILLDGRLAEMATGEGKTLAIALAACVAALGHTPVHVITANDYLAERDARRMGPLLAALGLSAGFVTRPLGTPARRSAWACDVVWCTAKELVFDYLRDGLATPRALGDLERRARRLSGAAGPAPLLRGLCMAIVDEADTVLIDEAVVPLVLSQGAAQGLDARFLAEVAERAAWLEPQRDFRVDGLSARLTDAGRSRLGLLADVPDSPDAPDAAAASWPASGDPLLDDPRHREDAVGLALVARHLLARDRDYVVVAGQVAIVDPATGRAAPGRAWSRGLHQFVELKEGLPLSAGNETVAQITFQRFFPRYLGLAGMSGTLAGSAGELARVYGLRVVAVPTRLPSRRRIEPLSILPDAEAVWEAVAARAAQLQAEGRPVLVGTGSVAESERLSQVLAAAGLPHAVLNARQDAAEGAIVAAAGQPGRITVATSMAGRGTDIELGEGVAARGGLHVILCQHNASSRIDRQFIGRAGRRGEPGSAQTVLSAEMPLLRQWLPGPWRRLLARALPGPLEAWIGGAFRRMSVGLVQRLATYTQVQQRQALCRADEGAERSLGFNRETLS